MYDVHVVMESANNYVIIFDLFVFLRLKEWKAVIQFILKRDSFHFSPGTYFNYV